jgi:putative resolvase
MNNAQKYITIKKASSIYGIQSQVFRRWEKKDYIQSIRTPGNVRMFAIADIEQMLSIDTTKTSNAGYIKKPKKNFIYCRVSSRKQADDLERQKQFLFSKYPEYTIIEDIGSGINFNRKGLSTILEYAMQKSIGNIVVAYKDRLARFGFELIEQIVKKGGGKIIVDHNDDYKSSEQELAEDLLAIIHVFNCRQMGRKRYKSVSNDNKNKED